jgi:predicted TIM-barrel fold metal-dependent hydrolase
MPSRLEASLGTQAPLSAIEDAWDCHIHVFGPRDRYPLSPDRRYTPGEATVTEAWAHAARLGVRRLVLVQASPYGHDNRCLLDALAALGPDHRGVVAVKASTLNDAALADLAAAGVRGVRLNPNGRAGAVDEVAAELRALTARLGGTGWHIEINCLAELATALTRLASPQEVPIVFDHLMGLDPAAANFSSRLEDAARLMTREPVWAKVSGTSRGPDLPDFRARQADAIGRLHESAPDRLIWGSDWPHTPLADGESGFRKVDDAQEARVALSASGSWAESLFRRNPERLFG